MSITQINIWTCEVCKRVSCTVDDDVGSYSDPVVVPPTDGWDYIGDTLACPECVARSEQMPDRG